MNFYTTLSSARRALLAGAFAIAGVTLLQGCFPVLAVGIGASALIAADRRTSGTYVDDESIEWKVSDLIRKHFGTINHVNVTSYNRSVLLTGEVQNESVSAEMQRLAGTVQNVRGVANELVVAPPSTLTSRSGDSAISTNVKSRFLTSKDFSANHIKIVTEAGTVFLLGIVTRAEGDAAAEIARTSKGVKRVVKVFEYIGETEAQAVDARVNNTSGEPSTNGSPPEAP
ncbi:MAG: BON domain-containing protein [Azoarcus sp.]|jgi:osmotically-inducible protein OsmY|nr:BON domain-containing protein [Azoarcus sp.]